MRLIVKLQIQTFPHIAAKKQSLKTQISIHKFWILFLYEHSEEIFYDARSLWKMKKKSKTVFWKGKQRRWRQDAMYVYIINYQYILPNHINQTYFIHMHTTLSITCVFADWKIHFRLSFGILARRFWRFMIMDFLAVCEIWSLKMTSFISNGFQKFEF